LPRGGDAARAAGLVEGTVLEGYRFTRYRRAPEDPVLEQLTISAPADPDVTDAVHRASVLAAAQNRARDLGNRAPNDLTPSALADYAVALGERHDAMTVTVLDEDELRERGMGAFAAVAQGSAEPAKLIMLEYAGAGVAGDAPRLALVGKAVTFDSGGLSLKPPNSMIEMKFDMMGGAAVIEAIGALAELRVPVRVLGVVGATENLVSDRSVKPGDVVTAMDGTTIEVNNTDAEGRLVLADCITHARSLGCDAIVDIATLTGGVVIALGATYAGLMASDDALAAQLIAAGERTGELLWRLPLHPAYAEMVKGRYAQLTNRSQRREASAITGAEFLHHFAGVEPWAHLDIAAVGDDGRAPYLDKGGTGFGVRLLAELAAGRA
jgi:leucyl aminopeptidase